MFTNCMTDLTEVCVTYCSYIFLSDYESRHTTLFADCTRTEFWIPLLARESHRKWKELGLALLCSRLAAGSAW